ncbi:MAG: Xaa-Pro aminopeptidase [Gammaproteobacteria bacterium]|nr:MAG: Xaa-Pro aminopeptidase [Gammaproteobacteria bacterium]
MKKKEFSKRRLQLMRMMGEHSIAILPAAPVRQRNRDVEYPFRQDSDFYYLTGFPEPEAVAVLAPGREHGEYILFCRERNPEKELWNGRRVGQEGARERYMADDSFPVSDINDILPGMLEHVDKVFYTMGCNSEFDQRLLGYVNKIRANARSGARTPEEFVSLEHLLHDMRLYKSEAEIKAMRHAADIASDAHQRAMRLCQPGVTEYQIEAELMHAFRKANAHAAYPPIVGGGANSCILHYTENSDELADGDLLLIDAGAEYEFYASDVTRTFPVNGRYSGEQRAIYELVLDAQAAAIATVKPGNSWQMPHHEAVKVLAQGLSDLKILKGSLDFVLESESYKQVFMHRTGHWLGMDVHDVGDYKVGEEWRELEPGMTLTVEPGLYIQANSERVDERWWNIGVRIEDDVLVTKTGCEVLSERTPKRIDDIEALMREGGV